ncbi:MAG: urea ABC transporter permease subunit UrtC, partial [Trichodesmium sp. St15_bin1_1]|nr:urea ABC transporter permease subunit UrtC [Trichodesmium sp. St15_bin1_1]
MILKLKSQHGKLLTQICIMVVIAVIFAIIMPLALSGFRLKLLGRFLSLAIVALGIDLIWGYTGLLSLGHGIFFALGGYGLAMHLKL